MTLNVRKAEAEQCRAVGVASPHSVNSVLSSGYSTLDGDVTHEGRRGSPLAETEKRANPLSYSQSQLSDLISAVPLGFIVVSGILTARNMDIRFHISVGTRNSDHRLFNQSINS